MNLTTLSLPETSLTGGGMILIILLIRLLCKKKLSAKILMALWYCTIVRLLLPFSLTVPSILGGWISHFTASLFSGTNNMEIPSVSSAIVDGTHISLEHMPLTIMDIAPGYTAFSLLPYIWLAGALLTGAYFCISYIHCHRIFRESMPVEADEAHAVLRQLSIRRSVSLRTLDKISSPLTYGVRSPVILLPKKVLEENREQPDLLSCILLHEGVHIKRYDALTKLMLAAVLTLHWFNPLVWLMYAFANRDIELCCDEIVINYLGNKKRHFYAHALLFMEESRYKKTAFYSYFSKNILEERIVMIMKKKNLSKLSIVAGVIIIVCVCTAFAIRADTTPDTTSDIMQNTAMLTDASDTLPTLGTENITPTGSGTLAAPPEENTSSTAASTSQEPDASFTSSFIWPVENCTVITATFGERVHPITRQVTPTDHITISTEASLDAEGSIVCTVADGTVMENGFDTEKGNYIIIEHANGLSTMYTHLLSIDVETDSSVAQGTAIGTVGKTGKVTGACLGFYVFLNGEAQNPLDYYPILKRK